MWAILSKKGLPRWTKVSGLSQFQRNSPAQIPSAKSIASGLAPPFAGPNAFAHVKEYCDGILLVSDLEIKQTVTVLFESKLVVEPSGSAGMASLLCGKVRQEMISFVPEPS